MSSRHFCRLNVVGSYQQRCANKIYNQNLKPYFKLTHHYVFAKYTPHILPFGGDTPFYAFGYEIEDFYLTRKKTGRRYGLRSKFILRYCLYTCICLYLMRRDVARRYKQRNHIQQ